MSFCKNNILFSIVVPIYNSEKYLTRCIESVQRQQFKNFEIILVEDKSTDASNKICNLFLKQYKNIKLIKHNKRYGVSVSRNDGINAATGKYIIFIDSDDYLLDDSLKSFAKFNLNNNDANLILLNSYFTKLGNNLIKSKNIFYNNVDGKNKSIDNLTTFLKKKNTPIESWRFVYKRNFLIKNKLFFINKINFGEDQVFVTNVLCSTNNLSIYFKPFYCFRVGSTNLRNIVGYASAISLFKVVNHLCKLIKNNSFSKLQRKFIKQKIYKPLIELKPQLMCLNKYQIDKLSRFIKKNNSNFKMLNNIYPKNDIYFFMRKYGEKKGLLMFKLFIVKKIKLLIKNKKFKEVYVFGLNIYSKGIIQVINNTNSLIKGIFDNNEQLDVKQKFGLKIILPRIFFSKYQEKVFKIFVIICNQEKKSVKKIYEQLKGFGLKKNQIIHVNFYN